MKSKNMRFLSLLLAVVLLFTTGELPVLAQTVGDNRAGGEEKEAIDTSFSDFVLEENDAVSENEPFGSGEREPEATISGQSLPGIQAGDITGPANPIHDHIRETTEFSYIYFGSYPQSEVRDIATMDAIDKAIATSGTSVDAGTDVWMNGEKYRRISKSDTSNSDNFDLIVNNGYRYFKYEPIKWKVLKNDGNTLFITAANALDCKKYNEEQKDITWENSDIRRWLNDGFYHTAFNGAEQSAIVEWEIKNEDNPKYHTEGGNDTRDKIYFLSIEEATSEEYGFCNECTDCSNDARGISKNVYVKARGGKYSVTYWWLRSPGGTDRFAVVETGRMIEYGYVPNEEGFCIRPALHIELSSDTWSMADDNDDIDDINQWTEEPTAAIPTDSSVAKNTKLSLSCATAGAEIYYTTDGTSPTLASTRYTEEITIDRNMVIRAIAARRGYGKSGEITLFYKLKEETAVPANPVHHCVKADDTFDFTDFSYIYFGSYPQSEVTDKATIDAIDKAVMTSGTVAEAGKDVWVNGTKYRRISKKDTNNYRFDNEPTNKGYRYFKWERLRWKVLQNDGKTLFVVADKAIDNKPFNEEQQYVTWETSTIREWLNDRFYHTAFSNNEQNAVVTQTIVNANNPDYGTSGGKNTNDKIWLLSIGEVTNEQYGFCGYDKRTISRRVQASGYTYARGGVKGDCPWLLRSPARYGDDVMLVDNMGKLVDQSWNDGHFAICPALHINLSSGLWSMTDDGTSGEAGEEKIPVSLQVSKGKTVYYTGEALATADLKVTASYKQHPAKELKPGEYTTNAAKINMNAPGKKNLTVSYTSGGATCTASITITVKALKKLSITGPSEKLAAGKKVRLTLKTTPKGASAASVKWTSSNKKYATVDQNGKVTVKKAGVGKTVTITATARGNSKVKSTYRFKIMKHAVKSITLKASKKTLKAGKSMTIKATVKTTGKSANKSLLWTSSNKKYATVSSKGKVTAKKAGKGKTVTITAKSTDGSEKKATVKITIK